MQRGGLSRCCSLHKANLGGVTMEKRPIVFDEWEAALKQTVAPELQREYREAIVKFRYWLKQTARFQM